MLNREYLRELREHCVFHNPRQNLYVLADHSGLPGLSRALINLGIEWVNLFGDDNRPELIKASPLLFDLTGSASSIRWLAEHANFSHSLLLISSPLQLSALASRLANRCDGILSDGVTITLRFFDTRVFPELLNVLNDADRSAWLGCANDWWYQARDGEIMHLESDFIDDERIPLPLSLTDAAMHALLEASEPDQVSDLLAQYTPHQFNAIPEKQRHAFVQQMIKRAISIGIKAPRDYAIYSGLMLLKGVDYDQSQEWAMLRKQISDGELTLSEAIERLEQEE